MSGLGVEHGSSGGAGSPWRKLFGAGEFSWGFNMRKGEAREFFGATEDHAELLAERRVRIDGDPGRYLGLTREGGKLVEAAWDLALGWGQVEEPGDGERTLAGLSRQWEADLLMLDQERLTFAAGAVCFPSSWSLEERIGQSIDEVHGVVPRLNAQIGEMITRFLKSLRPGKSARRENWSLTRSCERDYHPALKRVKLDETVRLDEIFLRVERQLFTGIPGGVLMGLRIETVPLRSLAGDPEVWGAVVEKIRTMPEDVAEYKGMAVGRLRVLAEMEGVGSGE